MSGFDPKDPSSLGASGHEEVKAATATRAKHKVIPQLIGDCAVDWAPQKQLEQLLTLQVGAPGACVHMWNIGVLLIVYVKYF